MLSTDEINQETQSVFTKLLTQLFTFLYKQKNEESKKMKQLLAKEFDCNFIDSDDEDEEEGNDQENEEDDYTPSHMVE